MKGSFSFKLLMVHYEFLTTVSSFKENVKPLDGKHILHTYFHYLLIKPNFHTIELGLRGNNDKI